ncbi:metallo-beta-lactamase family protein [Rhodovulum sp. P5]|uniref:MBL fold metallo-hydrolase n=1 Tax=Rhodovulum sp. P5 TaxID=1564506 RepID=UPI0009C31FC3|nr:MBL fold metallo-hydrolase [Rhodovulum sp. P5]ARE41222.1 metallo-beta-lactamase family protein [Rhodovulum sp. P5]
MYRITLTSALALGLALGTPAMAQGVKESPSTVDATYVAESVTEALAPGEKIENLYTKNVTQDYILQRLSDRVYFFQSQFYGTVFYVGDTGVLMFDALEGRAAALEAAVDEVTDLPITAILYSHDHADHIADAAALIEANPGVRVIATEATAELMDRLGSHLPRPTEVIPADANSVDFEGLTVRVVPFSADAHAHDHAAYVLEGTGVVHAPDVINPDQPPFWSFAGAEGYLGYRDLIDQIDALDWDYLSGGHGNVGARADIAFYRQFLNDLEAAVGEALGNVPWGAGIDDPARLNAHTAYLSNWIAEVGTYATDKLRPEYGDYYGFEYATPKNAELVGMYLFSYR